MKIDINKIKYLLNKVARSYDSRGELIWKYFFIPENLLEEDQLRDLKKDLNGGAYIVLGDREVHKLTGEKGLELRLIIPKK